MKQRYKISHNDLRDTLILSEYLEWEGNYDLMCEQRYERPRVEAAISQGISSLVSLLRVPNLYPISKIINNLSENVIRLYKNPNISELVIDWEDIAEFKALKEEEKVEVAEEGLVSITEDLATEDLDESFLDDDEFESMVSNGTASVEEDLEEEEEL